MGKIVVIGGGEIGRPGTQVETTSLDREIIRLTGKDHPHLLFLPTASSDAEGYVEVVQKHFGERLGCTVDSLLLIKRNYSKQELLQRIVGADIVYVGGGNTLKMMRRWRFLGVDKLLKTALNQGTVLSGLSAGGMCWFEGGHSDSMHMYGKKDWQYIKVKGLGFIPGIHCPHFDSQTDNKQRRADFMSFMAHRPQIGIGIDEKCAIEFVDQTYRVIAANGTARAYRVFRAGREVKIEEIEKSKDFRPMSLLYEELK